MGNHDRHEISVMLKDTANDDDYEQHGKQNHKSELLAPRGAEMTDQEPGGQSGGDNDRQVRPDQSRGNE